MSVVSLYYLNLLAWGSPLLISIIRGKFNCLHPVFFFPLLVIVSLSVSYTEQIYGWSNKFEFNGLRYLTSINSIDYFHEPMKLLLYSGIFYMLGIFLSSNIFKNNIQKNENLYNVSNDSNKLLFLISLFFIFLLISPIILLGAQKQGFYFTTLLFTSALYLPALVFIQSKYYGVCLYMIIFAVFLILIVNNYHFVTSKLYFFVLFFTIIFLILINTKSIFSYIKLRYILISIVSLFLLLYIVNVTSFQKGETGDVTAIYRIFYREYGFDMFAILVNEMPKIYVDDINWFKVELIEMIPGALANILNIEKSNAGIVVVQYFMQEEYGPDRIIQNVPSTYRYFLWPFYFEFSIYGVIFASFIFGFIGYLIYNWISILSNKLNDKKILIIMFPLIVNLHFILNGAYALGILNMIFGFFILIIIITIFNFLKKTN
tara:strand:- start:476 stop:1768 length:1293 start_codon:yes stop_codon:yes gene_type:complete